MTGYTDNTVLVDGPMDLVWDLTNDVESWPRLFTEYAEATIVERRGSTIRFRLTTVPDEEGRVWTWVSERTPDPATRTVSARRVDPGPFEYMNLNWEYREVEGGVSMRWRQDFHMKPEAPFDDRQMTDRMNARTEEQMAAVKRNVEAAIARRRAVPER
jgi:aromatase